MAYSITSIIIFMLVMITLAVLMVFKPRTFLEIMATAVVAWLMVKATLAFESWMIEELILR